MDIGIGLPGTIAGVEGPTVLEWARRGEARGFSTLGALDRIVYGNYDPLTQLAAAAAVTERIRLTTSILIAPLHSNHALFAKQTAGLDRLSGGRLVLALAVGGREDDYVESGIDFSRRGAEMDRLLDRARAVWGGESDPAIGPAPARAGGPQLVFGGQAPAAMRRMAKHGTGWIAGGGGPDLFKQGAAAAREAWAAAGREGKPRLLGLGYFSLGEGAEQAAQSYLRDYYAFAGPYAERVAAGALTSAEQVAERVRGMDDAGCDELILFPCRPDAGQVDLLAEACGRG